MKFVDGMRHMRGMRRLGHISRIMVKHGLGDFMDRARIEWHNNP